jgi:hypothetical protein
VNIFINGWLLLVFLLCRREIFYMLNRIFVIFYIWIIVLLPFLLIFVIGLFPFLIFNVILCEGSSELPSVMQFNHLHLTSTLKEAKSALSNSSGISCIVYNETGQI